MNVHKNAKLTPLGRAEIVHRVLEEGQTPTAVATAVGVCERTVRKWVARFRAEGTLDSLETVVAHAERSRSLTETAKALRRDAVGLAGAIRWVRRRVRLVCRLLTSVAELLPERFALGIAGLIPLRAYLDTGRALVELRRLPAPHLSVLPMPLGFRRDLCRASEIRPGFQHKLGHDPPPSAA